MSTNQVQATSKEINQAIIEGIQDVKGKKIVLLDLRNLPDASANYFIICEGDSTTQVSAINGSISRKVKTDCKFTPNNTEGVSRGKWICMDYYETVVHIFYPETREFYDLEELWSDAVRTDIEDIS
ncbi:MAG TPA: ribosome silencing factor [Saprospiraceae bacterium]|nr:ribosome silencing factor [Saprospiraceae bacterium]